MPQPLEEIDSNAMHHRPSNNAGKHAVGHRRVASGARPGAGSGGGSAGPRVTGASRHEPGSRRNPISLSDDDEQEEGPTSAAMARLKNFFKQEPLEPSSASRGTPVRSASTTGPHSTPRIKSEATHSTPARYSSAAGSLSATRVKSEARLSSSLVQSQIPLYSTPTSTGRDMATVNATPQSIGTPWSMPRPFYHTQWGQHRLQDREAADSSLDRRQEADRETTRARECEQERMAALQRREDERILVGREQTRQDMEPRRRGEDPVNKNEEAAKVFERGRILSKQLDDLKKGHDNEMGTWRRAYYATRENDPYRKILLAEARVLEEEYRKRKAELGHARRIAAQEYQRLRQAVGLSAARQVSHGVVKTEDAEQAARELQLRRQATDLSAAREADHRRRKAELEVAVRAAAREEDRLEQARREAAREKKRLKREQVKREASSASQRPEVPTFQSHRGVKAEDTEIVDLTAAEASKLDGLQDLLCLPEIDFPEHERPMTPKEMSCKLLPHQQVALKWLKDREHERGKCGGILADAMGLGKTIQALALILSHKARIGTPKTTLIVAPVALLRQWEREIQDKVKPNHILSSFIYHGRARTTRQARRLFEYDVVLTSYETVVADRRNVGHYNEKALLYSDKFLRVILDEAHRIKNQAAQCSYAVADLQALYRLCMTGTPFMNSAIELFPLLRFIRIKPYNNLTRFRQDIGNPIRKWDKDPEEYKEAMERLRAVFRSISLRRTKKSVLDGKPIITLPKKTIHRIEVVLDEEQREFYDALELQQQIRVNKYLKRGMTNKVYTFILVLLLRLRQVCCHPFLIKNHGIPDEAALNGKEMVQLALRLNPAVVARIAQKTEFECPLCEEAAEVPIIISPCGHDICANCFSGMMILSQSQRGPVPGDDMDHPTCPQDGCEVEIDPRKVLCHSFFQVAHDLGDRARGMMDDSGEASGSDVDSEDPTQSDDDFIVGDDEVEYEEEEEGEEGEGQGADEDGNRSEAESKRASGAMPRTSRRSTLHKDLLESQDECDLVPPVPSTKKEKKISKSAGKRSAKAEKQEPEETGDIWAQVRRRHSEGWIFQADSDSDSSIFSLSDLLNQPAAAKQPTPAENDATRSKDNEDDVAPSKDDVDVAPPQDEALASSKRKTREESPLERPEKRVKIEKQPSTRRTRSSVKKETEEEEEAEPKLAKKEKKQRKKKKKGPELTLSDLRKKSLNNKNARARYMAKLREDFVSSAKVDKTLDILRSIRDDHPGEKTLVFSLWTSFLDLLEIPLSTEHFNFLRYDGATDPVERDANVAQLQDPNSGVEILLVSLQAGSAGLNLTAASHVVILEPFWNPFIEDQAVGRAYRLGQTRQVNVYRLLVPDSVEDRIQDSQETKRARVDAALSESGAVQAGRLTTRDLRRLFGFR